MSSRLFVSRRCSVGTLVTLALGAVGALPGPCSAGFQPPLAHARAAIRRTVDLSDPLPAGALLRFGSLRYRCAGDVKAVAFAPDGKSFASASSDRVIRFWNLQTGQEIRRFVGHDETVMCLAFSADGKTLASGGYDQTVRLWDVATGKELHKLQTAFGWISSVAFAPDGKTLASGSRNRVIHLWDVESGRQLQEIIQPTLGITSLVFSRDGETLASASKYQGLALWEVATGKLLKKLEGHRGNVHAVAVSPDGKILASAGTDHTIRLWDMPQGTEIRRMEGHQASIYSLTFTNDGESLISGAGDGTIRWWNVAEGKEQRVFRAANDETISLALAPDGKTLVSAAYLSQLIRVWDTATGKERDYAGGHGSAIVTMAFSADGSTLATAGKDRTLRLWDAAKGTEKRVLAAYQSPPHVLAFSPDGKRIATAEQRRSTRLWDVATGNELAPFKGSDRWVIGFHFSATGEPHAWISDGIRVGGHVIRGGFGSGEPHMARLVEWDADKEIYSLRPDLIAPAAGLTPAESTPFPGHLAPISSVAMSSPGRDLVATGSQDKTIGLWRLQSGKFLGSLNGHAGAVSSLAFSGDDRFLASIGDDRSIRIWEVATHRTVAKIEPVGAVRAVALTRDGRTVAWAGGLDNQVHLIDLANGGKETLLTGHGGQVESLVFSPDGKRLASGSADTTVLMWEIKPSDVPAKPRLDAIEQDVYWLDLAEPNDVSKPYDHVARLLSVPEQAVPFFKTRLADGKKQKPVAKIIAELDDPNFAVRKAASASLEALGELARAEMVTTLTNKPSLEIRQRLEAVLLILDQRKGLPSPDELRQIRSVMVLEWLGTPDARKLLGELAHGSPAMWQTKEATAALERLGE